jgi:hypothetical protein
MHTDTDPVADGPQLDPGVTLLERPSARSPALQRVVLSQLSATTHEALWVDARNNAASYALYERAPSRRHLEGIALARAFTAYQHHSLVRALVEQAGPDTDLVVVPCTASLYADDDVPDDVAAGLLGSSLRLLREVATTYDVPVLVTVPGRSSALDEQVVGAADRTLTATRTDQGLRFDGDGYETQVYWQDGYWQTTIPYWVDLCGCVCDAPDAAPTPVEPAPLLEG